MKFKLSILFFLLLHSYFGQNLKSDLKQLELLKKTIRQATYYDSISVFSNGKKAIKIAQKLKLYADEGKIYQYYGNFYYFSSNDKKAKEYYLKTIAFAEKHNLTKLINGTKIRLAFIKGVTDNAAAEIDFQFLLNEALKNKMFENAIEACNGIGILYEDRKINDIALEYYLKGLKLAEKHDFHYLQGMMLNNIGLIKLENNQNNEALKDFEKALQFANQTKEYRLVFNLQNNLGIINKKLNKHKISIEYYKKNYIYAKKLGFPVTQAVTLMNLADSYLQAQMYEESSKNIQLCISLLKGTDNYDYIQTAYLLKSRISLHYKNFSEAKNYIDSATFYNKFYPDPNLLAEIYNQNAALLEKQNKYKEALTYYKKYREIQDSLSRISSDDKFAQLQILYGKEKDLKELAKQKAKNTLLKKDNLIKQTNLRLTIFIGVFIIVLIVGLLILRYSYISRKQQKLFSRKLIENLDQERSRISKDLHDDLGQMLSIIKSKVHMYTSRKADVLESVENDLSDAINVTRNISHSLHPYFVSKIGLMKSIATILDKTQESTNLICSYEIDETVESFSLDEKTQIYHIVQECVNNTIKHANAKSLKVIITKNLNNINFQYRDNGNGFFDDSNAVSGIGLMTIKERAKILDANSVITFQNKSGFYLNIKFTTNESIIS
ncbi:MAG: histidine kinase [Flavobacteriia bacterium]|jgi:two-component system NarL family sensor kinase